VGLEWQDGKGLFDLHGDVFYGEEDEANEEHRDREHGLRLVFPPCVGAKVVEGAHQGKGQQREPNPKEAHRIARVPERDGSAEQFLALGQAARDPIELVVHSDALLVGQAWQALGHPE
jgi:hypothetical protein